MTPGLPSGREEVLVDDAQPGGLRPVGPASPANAASNVEVNRHVGLALDTKDANLARQRLTDYMKSDALSKALRAREQRLAEMRKGGAK